MPRPTTISFDVCMFVLSPGPLLYCAVPLVQCTQEDFMKAVRKIAENKKLEGKVDYAKV